MWSPRRGVERETIRWIQPVGARCNQETEHVSRAVICDRRQTYQYPNRRTVVEIQERVFMRCKQRLLVRMFLAGFDEAAIATWGRVLEWVLYVFNVRAFSAILNPLTTPFQPRPVIDTHKVNTRKLVSNFRRTPITRDIAKWMASVPLTDCPPTQEY